jgi:nitronate monooxygenase
VVAPLHAIGCKVFADVASLAHAHKAAAAGVDGLVLLTAGAGGQTGWANPFAFVRAVRRFFDGPLVLAGGVADGQVLWAAKVLGCDLAYMGTRFIATQESLAAPAYKQALVDAEFDDVMTTKAFTGLATNMLRSSIIAAGLDPDRLNEMVTPGDTREIFGASAPGPRRWTDIWSAGHSVSGVTDTPPVAELVERLAGEYAAAKAAG